MSKSWSLQADLSIEPWGGKSLSECSGNLLENNFLCNFLLVCSNFSLALSQSRTCSYANRAVQNPALFPTPPNSAPALEVGPYSLAIVWTSLFKVYFKLSLGLTTFLSIPIIQASGEEGNYMGNSLLWMEIA